ncbi:hypothetical protein GLOIN_2v1779593 [Rhizophagus irregularis DAOM 181602=DAOM 197198]|uniref:Uncharacterized protein n=1 Tax=Rhizophagus irregularis (strain DAOM 181602 / DAOM 197198 / MUCL 43194) TaxID=747089 RepID=A0A2P4PPG5_RHIID|nr:hypothetical protein GLOIN_2v1779593 [Rhizophagus irregularis DAOM 181602=DAOM 197198]POG67273.1 hypothetical protein GLOIN_2v1779593 [Rhizophagus irregularis DAOM 181602=DAOM 197198]|eukprot:XP_025174139.1 hypothetical protein GLOIN_2v1779593 [Rhizophagus irregularis DAOM 181602=DAOM 197198]
MKSINRVFKKYLDQNTLLKKLGKIIEQELENKLQYTRIKDYYKLNLLSDLSLTYSIIFKDIILIFNVYTETVREIVNKKIQFGTTMSVAKNGIQIAVLAKLIEILIQFIMKYQNNTGLDIKEIHHEIRKKLQNHERNVHKNNKLIPYRHILHQPSNETMSFYRDAIIIRLKNSLGFNRHSVGKKHITIDAFPENKIFKYDQIIFRENINTSTRGYILFENNDGQYKAIFNWKQKELKENTRNFLSGILTINFIADSGEFINDQENYVVPLQPLQPPSSNDDHILHIIYSNPPYNASNNKLSSNNKSTTFTKPQYRYILPHSLLSNTNNS